MRMEFASFEDYWRPYVGNDGQIAQYVSTLALDEQSRLRDLVRSAYLDGALGWRTVLCCHGFGGRWHRAEVTRRTSPNRF